MYFYNMSMGREYQTPDLYLEEVVERLSLHGYRTCELVDSKYDALEEKWYFYYRVLDEYGYTIIRVHL